MDGKILLPESPFDSERVRYEHRLLPFSSLLTPPPVLYQEFLDITNVQVYKRNVSIIIFHFLFLTTSERPFLIFIFLGNGY